MDRFRNQTGYTKPASLPPPSLLPHKPTLPDIVLPDPTDNNFKFDALVGLRAAPGTRVEPPDLSAAGGRLTNYPDPSFSQPPPIR